MSEKEITREQFLAIMAADPSATAYSSGTSDPVQQVNLYHAIAFCNKLSIQEGLTPAYSVKVGGTEVAWASMAFGDIPTSDNAAVCDWTKNGYRLPTEMEWMWAAMGAPPDGQGGGTTTTGYTKAFAGSTGSNVIGDYAWYKDNSGNKTHPAGSKAANELGLYDMSGNVWEWCWDWYAAAYPDGTLSDYLGAASGTTRVIRGGSWNDNASYCTVAIRYGGGPDYLYGDLGFRLVRP